MKQQKEQSPKPSRRMLLAALLVAATLALGVVRLVCFPLTDGAQQESAGSNLSAEVDPEVSGDAQTQADASGVGAEVSQQEEPSDSVAAKEPEEPSEPETLSIVMVGDILLHLPLQWSGEQEDGSYNYDHFFAHTSDLISAADLAIVNQEVILGGTELGLSGYPAFNGAYEVGDALVKAGFDIICHATNHALDMGETGLLNCLNFWETSYPDIAVLGIHDSQESRDTLYYYDWDGYKIAILNYTYGTNGIALPESYEVDLLDEDQVVADLAEARETADFIIVVPHWGTEYTFEPDESQEYWTQLFLENGVDLVIGAHPHVIQPVELLEDGDGNQMLVYYSLGNFINFTNDSDSRARAVGAMATVTLSAMDGEITISDYGVIPLVCQMVRGTGNPTVYPLSEYTEELAEESEMSEKDPLFSLEYCQELCREVFGELYQE